MKRSRKCYPELLINQTDWELTQKLELAEKDIQTVIITVFCMFKKLSRDREDI